MAFQSKRKGDKFERELAQYFSEKLGVRVERSLYCNDPYQKGIGNSDLIGATGLSIEAKRTETLRVHEAMKQSVRNAGKNEKPIVIHRRSRQTLGEAHVIISLSDFVELYRMWGVTEGHFIAEKFDDTHTLDAGAPEHTDEQAEVNA